MGKGITAALIVAAGRGHRLGGEVPKQFLMLGDRAVLDHTLTAFLDTESIDLIQVVIHPDDRSLYAAAIASIDDDRLLPPAFGGDSRAASVRLGLEALAGRHPDKVLIHDAARPFAKPRLIAKIAATLDRSEGAFAAIRVVDALWSSQDGMADHPVPRDALWRAQTPQGFHFEAILAAHRACDFDAADDVAVARAAGLTVEIVEGHEANFKITTAEDLDRATRLLQR